MSCWMPSSRNTRPSCSPPRNDVSATPDLVVDSVTGVDVVLPIAGPGARSFAFLIDWFIRAILSVAWFVVSALVHNARWSLAQPLIPDAAWFIFVAHANGCDLPALSPRPRDLDAWANTGQAARWRAHRDATGGSPGVAALLTRNAFRIIDSFPARVRSRTSRHHDLARAHAHR